MAVGGTTRCLGQNVTCIFVKPLVNIHVCMPVTCMGTKSTAVSICNDKNTWRLGGGGGGGREGAT